MTESNANLMWVVFFRTLQTALDAAPTLLCGLLIAGLLRGMVGTAAIRRWFTDDPKIGPIRGFLTGLVTPVCSFGVLPIAWELRRAGVSRGAVITYLLAAPLVNPFGLIDAFQTLEGEGPLGLAMLAFLVAGAFVTLAGLGVVINLWLPATAPVTEPTPLPASDLRRIAVVLLSAARGLNGVLLLFLAIGLSGAGLLAVVPHGALERATIDRSIEAPVKLALVSIPFQVTATRGIAMVCESLFSGVALGSVFVLFLLGIGLHLGTLVWIGFSYGLRTLLLTVAMIVAASLAVAYTLPITLTNATSVSDKGTHFLEIESSGGYKVAKARAIRATITNDAGQPQWFLIAACGTLGVLWLTGLVTGFLGERGTASYVMSHGAPAPVTQPDAVWSKPLSAPQRALTGMAVVLALVIAGMYLYYPAPIGLVNQMDGVQSELGLLLKSDPLPRRDALRLTAKWQRLQGKVAVADLLRQGTMRPPVRQSTAELRTAIDKLRVGINDRSSPEELKDLFNQARQATNRCRESIERGRSG